MIKAKMMPMIARSNQGLFAGSDEVAAAVVAGAGAATGPVVVGVGRGRVFNGLDVAEGTTAGAEDDPEGTRGTEETAGIEAGAAGVEAGSLIAASRCPPSSFPSCSPSPFPSPPFSFLSSLCPPTTSHPSTSTSTPLSRQTSHHPLITSSLLPPPHSRHRHPRLSLANSLLTLSLPSIPPTCPRLSAPIISLRIASSAVRTPHAGCHVSS